MHRTLALPPSPSPSPSPPPAPLQHRSRRWATALAWAALALFGASPASRAADGPPPAPSEPVIDTLHGVAVADPYRNLENTKRADTQAWLKAQGNFAADQLARINGRDVMAARVQALTQAAGDTVRSVTRMPAGHTYYLLRQAGSSQFKLMLQVGLGSTARVLVDPQKRIDTTGVPHAINYFRPSWDNRTLAYGLSAGGSEDASLHLQDIASGRQLGQPIPRVHEDLLHWTPDSRHLAFNQVRALPAGTPETETFLDSTVVLLDRSRPAAAPRPLFGPLVNTALKLDRLDVASVLFAPGSRWMLARTTDTTVPEGKLFAAPLADLPRGAAIRWHAVSTFDDKITDAQMRGDTLYLRTYAGAPRGRVLALDLRQPRLVNAVQRVAEPSSGVLTGFALAADAVYTEVQQGFASRVMRHADNAPDNAPGNAPADGVDLAPGQPGTTALVGDEAHSYHDVWVATSAWTAPPRVLRLSPGSAPQDTGLRRDTVPPGTPELTVTEVLVRSHDGAQVPLAIIHRKGLLLDGSNPTLLVGYGAYGFSFEARFDPRSIAWLEQGGVMAYANVRGSGAFGDAWYRAGFKASKPNTWLDGIACAKWLIAQRYASPATLGIWGTSAGGIFVGRAVTTAPDLFAAAIFDVGVMDAVRAEESANGITNISEFGSSKNPAEFAALLAMSPYHQMRDNTAYPAVLLIHGLNDPRVDVWHSAKAAARLQAASNSGKPVLLRLDAQAGHGVGSTAQQAASKNADIYSFLLWQFGNTGLKP